MPRDSQMTDLGVTNNLSWTEHVYAVSNKVHGILWGLKHYRNSLFRPLRVRFVSSLIFPIFDYCAAIFSDLMIRDSD